MSALKAAIQHALKWYLFEDAAFLAEVLYTEARNDENLFILGHTYFLSGQIGRAYAVLKGSTDASCRYLFAVCCIRLDKLQEGEIALTGGLLVSAANCKDFAHTQGAAEALLAKIVRKSNRTALSHECLQRSHALNPFLFSVYESLCTAGVPPSDKDAFQCSQALLRTLSSYPDPLAEPAAAATSASSSLFSSSSTSSHTVATPAAAASAATPASLCLSSLSSTSSSAASLAALAASETPGPSTPALSVLPSTPAASSLAAAIAETPSRTPVGAPSLLVPCSFPGSSSTVPVPSYLGSPSPAAFVTPSPRAAPPPPVAPPLKAREREREPPPAPRELRKAAVRFQQQTPESPPKGVMKLFSSSFNDSKRKAKVLAASVRAAEGAPSTPDPAAVPKRMRTAMETSATAALAILAAMGRVIALLSKYRCREALEAVQQLPGPHAQTGWAYCQQGRAHFELTDYKAADSAFRMARRVEPHRLDGMAVYSTVLWHLRRETALSYLAHEVVAVDRGSPQAWCVVGNCFSLQKDHDAAVKFFQRAIQVDSEYAYAYTLLGHEHIYNEDFAKALACFRAAIRCDPRHYNAWYGLGIIHYRQEKHVIAEQHFRHAVAINPSSPVLLCYQGMVQHAQKKSHAALELLDQALRMDESSPLAHFHKAVVLSALERDAEALAVLDRLRQLAPKESSVYFLMGKIFKKLGQSDKAAMHFAWAMDLDPRGSQHAARETAEYAQLTDDDIRAVQEGTGDAEASMSSGGGGDLS